MDLQALLLSLRLATATALLLALLATPLAAWLAFGRSRARFLIEAVTALPLVLPPTVLGFYLLLATSPRQGFGHLLERLLGHPFPFSFLGILVASVIYSLPFATQPMVAAFRAQDPRFREVAWTLGASRFRTFQRVVLPLAWPGVLSGLLMAFAHTLGEFGAILMIGGGLPGRTRTASVAIYDQVQGLEYAQAHQSALALLVLALVLLVALQFLRRRAPWA
jgi:molybdate transport system permease protein